MPKESIEVEEVFQEIKEDVEEEIQFDPSDIREFSVSNIIDRTLAHLIGRTVEGSRVPIKVTGDGKLVVASTPGGLTTYVNESGSASDTYVAENTYILTEPYTTIDILIESNDALISFRDEGKTWGPDIPLPTGYHSIDFNAYGIKIKNRVAASVADYSITLWR